MPITVRLPMKMKEKKGFTIVEMAVVVVVVGLLLAIGFKLISPFTERIKRSKTNQIIDAAVASVTGFAQTYGRLPTTAEFAGVVKNSQDVWGRGLIYRADPRLLTEGSICSQGTTGTTVNICVDAACAVPSDTAQNTAFFILSGGANMNIQTLVDVSSASATIDTYPLELPNIDDDTSDMNRAESYKDISKWMVLPELRLKLGCAGPPLKILDTPLPSGLEERGYEADIFATGGVPWADAAGPPPAGDDDTADDYEWCVTSALPPGLTYQCNGTLAVSAICTISSGTWQRCSYIHITGIPTAGGSYNLHVYAKDEVDNFDDQSFALAITPSTGLKVCSEYRIWNEKPGNPGYQVRQGYDEVLDPIIAACMEPAFGAEIVFAGKPTNNTIIKGEVLEQHMSPSHICDTSSLTGRVSFNNAILADTNGDCCIDFETTLAVDRACP